MLMGPFDDTANCKNDGDQSASTQSARETGADGYARGHCIRTKSTTVLPRHRSAAGPPQLLPLAISDGSRALKAGAQGSVVGS